uniref:hypothetical protein n=1 Tax=Streptomyces sp. GSL17-113 TaxID=3115365 RepID=UPI002E77867E
GRGGRFAVTFRLAAVVLPVAGILPAAARLLITRLPFATGSWLAAGLSFATTRPFAPGLLLTGVLLPAVVRSTGCRV